MEGVEMTVLNLGCGNEFLVNAINHDLTQHSAFVSVVWDLNSYPWIFHYLKSAPYDEIYMTDVLEHLNEPVKALEECWRLLKPSGALHLRVPYGLGENAHTDPTHIRFFMPRSMDYFVRGTEFENKYGYYSKARFIVEFYEHDAQDNLCWTLRKDVSA
jgi:SAM-dependent methyltransferase